MNDHSHLQLTFRAHLQEAMPEIPQDLYKTMRALGDETRLKILKAIHRNQSSTQSLAVELKLTEACISKHLKILCEADILYKHRKGNYIYYLMKNMQLDRIPLDIYQYLDG
jgi:DNA-binding transcriptional ArsR family regulator